MRIHYDFGLENGNIDSAYFWVAIEDKSSLESLAIIYEVKGEDAIPEILKYALFPPSICEKLIKKRFAQEYVDQEN